MTVTRGTRTHPDHTAKVGAVRELVAVDYIVSRSIRSNVALAVGRSGSSPSVTLTATVAPG